MRFLQLLIFSLMLTPGLLQAQDEVWFYLRANSDLFEPSFERSGTTVTYTGTDEKLRKVLSRYKIAAFKKTQRKTNKQNKLRTFFVMADKETLLDDLLQETPHLFASGEIIPESDKKIHEPNDYGLTSTIGENIGLQADLSYLDYLGAPEAWYYTTGSPDVIIAISDARVDTTHADFKDKTTILRKSTLSNGHGYSSGGTAAAQGDNGQGIAGICYDCSLYSTNYGDQNNMSQLKEAAEKGAKVINCSWIGRKYDEVSQAVIDTIFNNGTIIVASGGNKNWKETKGSLKYYPASYDKVIAVSSVMYKYEDPLDNLGQLPDGTYFSANVRGYLGRTMGFTDNDTLKQPFIYPVSVRTLNEDIDLLAPTHDIFMYSYYLLEGKVLYHDYSTTSGASPFVSGTVGLMFSLYPCLPSPEVESILKCAATNIDHIAANKPYEGMYGAGMLNIGKTIKLLHDLKSEEATAYIEDQQFSRWDFTLTAFSEAVVLRNQKFTNTATLDLTAKNSIVLSENTVLRPSGSGSVHLKIDPSMEKQCDLEVREDQ
jgi:subtilisin family serine protease